MKPALPLLVFIALTVPAEAGDVYRWMEGGTVVYSGQPPQSGVAADPAARTDVPVSAPESARPRTPAEPAPAADATASSTPARTGPATAEEILETSGLRPQLSSLARTLGLEFVPRHNGLRPADVEAIGQVVTRHLTAERLYPAVQEEFRRRVDHQKDLDAMAEWFRSPLGVKITALEVAASRPDALEKLAAFAEQLKTVPPPAARVDLVQRLDWVSGASHETTEILLMVSTSFARAAMGMMPPERRATPGMLQRRADTMRGRLGRTVADRMRTQLLYVYAPLEDAELMQYVTFVASPAGRAYGRATRLTVMKVVREAVDRTARDIVRTVPLERLAPQQVAAPVPPGETSSR
jgi:hypothetical protein